MVQLDGFRFFAVSGVMVGHWLTYPYMNRIGPMLASFGVNLFFVLSGFLISQILINSKFNVEKSKLFILKQFYIRRFLRIFPLYYLVVLLGWIFKVPSDNTSFFWFVTYTTNIICGINQGHCGYFTHLWSLAVEEQFYIIFPFIILLILPQKLLQTFLLLIVLAICSRLVIYFILKGSPDMEWASYTLTPCCFDAFGIGAVLAYLKIFSSEQLLRILNRTYVFFGILLFCLGLYFFSLGHPKLNLPLILSYRLTLSIFCFWLIGVGSFSEYKGLTKRILENRVVVYLGKISYGIYVYHHFIPWVLQKLGFDGNNHSLILDALFYFSVTVGLSVASWHLFESPINGLKRFFNYNSMEKVTGYIYAEK